MERQDHGPAEDAEENPAPEEVAEMAASAIQQEMGLLSRWTGIAQAASRTRM
jgi:hypothetical protein